MKNGQPANYTAAPLERALLALSTQLTSVPPSKLVELDFIESRPVNVLGVAGGIAGHALTRAYLARAGLCDSDVAVSCLRELVTQLKRSRLDASLFDGYAGVGWVIHHVVNDVLPELLSAPADVKSIDTLLATWVRRYSHRLPVDLTNGLCGIGVYFLSRLPSDDARAGLEEIVRALARRLERSSTGLFWRSATNSPLLGVPFPNGFVNLGVAHGLPGAIAFLAQCESVEIGGEAARTLRSGLTDYLYGTARGPSSPTTYPGWVDPDDNTRAGGGVPPAWCYGDIGVACALATAGHALADTELINHASDVAARAARAPLNTSTAIRDPGLCHGTLGVALMFASLESTCISGSEAARAKSAWLARALALREEGVGVGGFTFYDPSQSGGTERRNYFGVQRGAAGVALALLRLAGTATDSWTKLFLIR